MGEKVKDCYQDAAPGIIALEEKAQKIIWINEINDLLSLKKMAGNLTHYKRKPAFLS